MNILVTLNGKYLKPLKVMLWSLAFNNRDQGFRIFLMHSSIPQNEIDELRNYMDSFRQELVVITVPAEYFDNAPVVKHYSREMYYRLLAPRFLPGDLDRILYLDPDILVINPIDELYNIEMGNYYFAASYHDRVVSKGINMIRLKTYEMTEYFNSGVLLMNLPLLRKNVDEKEIFDYIKKNQSRLFLPDQDILNALYSKKIKKIDEIKYNYDVRYYHYYKIQSSGEFNMDYVMRNTVFLHFCGKKKPWHTNYSGHFHSLYKHYETLALNRNRSGISPV